MASIQNDLCGSPQRVSSIGDSITNIAEFFCLGIPITLSVEALDLLSSSVLPHFEDSFAVLEQGT